MTTVPINRFESAAQFLLALAEFAPLVARVGLLSELADGGDAMLLYDMVVEPIVPLRLAEHFTVSGTTDEGVGVRPTRRRIGVRLLHLPGTRVRR